MSNENLENEIDNLKIQIVNFNEKSVVDITSLVGTFNLYESIFNTHNTCDLILMDSIQLVNRLPINGEEYVVFQYKTKGLKESGDEYTLRTRSFRIYKITDRVEQTETTTNYKLHGIDDHYFINEAYDVNQSFVGSNCIAAAEGVFKSYFVDPAEFRPFDKQKRNLVDTEDTFPSKGYKTPANKQSVNNSSYIAPGTTPIEVITFLKDEAINQSTTDTSNYLFYQDLIGHKLKTLSELKSQESKYTYFVKQTSSPEGSGAIEEDNVDSTTTDLRNNIMDFTIRKTTDAIKNINSGMYGNRVVAIDTLTKKFDEKIFSYAGEWESLSPIDDPSKSGAKLISETNAENKGGFYGKIGSTQTRYVSTELISNSIHKGNPTNFSDNEHPSYKQTPYFYPVDKEDPDELRDKVNGTIKNEDADKRLESIVSNDSRISTPNLKHTKLNREVASLATLDNIVVDVVINGNSDIKAGDVIKAFFPAQFQEEKRYIAIFGESDPRFLVTDVRQAYLMDTAAYITTCTLVKDSLNVSVEKIFEKEKDEADG